MRKTIKGLLILLIFSTQLVSCGGGERDTKSWGVAEMIETDNAGNAIDPQVAFDANDNALAVWSQRDDSRSNSNIWSNRYEVSSSWNLSELVETEDVGYAKSPQVAFDASGNALAVWMQTDGTRYNIWSNRYVIGTGWGAAEQIEVENAGSALSPQIAVDANGNALAVWFQDDGSARYSIWSNRYVIDTGWGAAELIETDNSDSARDPQVAFDANGNALAVWHQNDDTRYNIWSNRYVIGTGWGAAELIETNNVGAAAYSQVAFDASGNALVVWEQSDGNNSTDIWSNRYVIGTGWGVAELIETNNSGPADYPQVAVNASGNGLAVWSQTDGTWYNIWSNRYVVGTGWGIAELIETNSYDARDSQIAFDASGNALAVWEQADGTFYNIWSNRYMVGTGWGMAELIEIDNSGDALNPQIACDASGNAFAVWEQSDGIRKNIWSNRFE